MHKNRNGIIKDEMGVFFVFGPWWFVIIVMVLGVIASMFRNNNPKNNNIKQFTDYEPVEKSPKTIENYNICPNCGNKNSVNAKFCNGCGDSLNMNNNRFCAECGEKNSKDAKYCKECGNELDII
jgi:ribosomal protein L40E